MSQRTAHQKRGADPVPLTIVKLPRHFLRAIAVLSGLAAEAAEPPSSLSRHAPIESRAGEFVFSLLPKAFQKNPLVNMSVITEMTQEGKMLAAPTAEYPGFYVAQAGGIRVEGRSESETPPPTAEIERIIQRSLATTHYHPTPAGRTPQYVVVYHWGAHNLLEQGFPNLGHKNLISRAALAGGKKFADEFARVVQEEDLYREAGSYALFGDSLSPLRLFREKSAHHRELVEQASAACYYVAVSAYEYATVARGRKVLLWRTKMTADSRGISMVETLPSLIATAGPYFGREMEHAATPMRRIPRQGRVEVGTPQVVPDTPATAVPPAAKNP